MGLRNNSKPKKKSPKLQEFDDYRRILGTQDLNTGQIGNNLIFDRSRYDTVFTSTVGTGHTAGTSTIQTNSSSVSIGSNGIITSITTSGGCSVIWANDLIDGTVQSTLTITRGSNDIYKLGNFSRTWECVSSPIINLPVFSGDVLTFEIITIIDNASTSDIVFNFNCTANIVIIN